MEQMARFAQQNSTFHNECILKAYIFLRFSSAALFYVKLNYSVKTGRSLYFYKITFFTALTTGGPLIELIFATTLLQSQDQAIKPTIAMYCGIHENICRLQFNCCLYTIFTRHLLC